VVEGSWPKLHDGATWQISSVGSPLKFKDKLDVSGITYQCQSMIFISCVIFTRA